jgi:acetyl esterase/lipase
LIRTRLVCLGFRQAVIWWQRRARILRSACIRLSNAADKERCRPDFAVAIYPGHLSLSAARWDAKQGTKKLVIRYPATADKDLGLNPDIPVTPQTPPTFLLQAEDDHVDNVDDSLAYYIALKKAGVPVEMHLYAQGGHAFGLRRTKFPITEWPQLVETWLRRSGWSELSVGFRS